jgi:hypothetical protein
MSLLLLMHSCMFLKASCDIPSDPEYEDSDPTGMSMRTTMTEKTMIHLEMILLQGLNDSKTKSCITFIYHGGAHAIVNSLRTSGKKQNWPGCRVERVIIQGSSYNWNHRRTHLLFVL